MKSNAIAGAVSLVGLGICGIAVAMLLQTVGPRAEASPRGADAFGPGEPHIVWITVSSLEGDVQLHTHLRLWSDKRLEHRTDRPFATGNDCPNHHPLACEWPEIPPPPRGDDFACRADTNGDRRAEGADFATVLGT